MVACVATPPSWNTILAPRIRAERHIGEPIKELARTPPSESGASGGFAKTLTDNNISTQTASRDQALADVPDARRRF